jgi:hypothetical protein
MHASMRSQDLWLGFGYDIFAATVLHELVAGWVGAQLGDYNLHVDSLHLYDDHLGAAADLPAVIEPSPVMPRLAIAWHDFDPTLREIIAGGPVEHAGWREVGEVMGAYRAWRSGSRSEARRIATPFRPFAPVVLADKAPDFFTLGQPSPYMSIASGVTELARKVIPSVVYVNGTARVQTVTRHRNPLLAEVLEEFEEITGVPVLINTSLNVKGKPICGTPDMALDCLTESGLDGLLIEDWWVTKR